VLRRAGADAGGGGHADGHKSPFEKIAKYLADYKVWLTVTDM